MSNNIVEENDDPSDDSGDSQEPPQLLSFADQHKIVLRSTPGKSLGFSIRGGKEFDLGVYVSRYV